MKIRLHEEYEYPDGSKGRHVYTVDRAPKVGTSDVVKEIWPDYAEYMNDPIAVEFGNNVHAAINLDLSDDLDIEHLDYGLINPLEGSRAFRAQYDVVPLFHEQPLYCSKYDFCCQPDLVCRIGIATAIIDWKTGSAIQQKQFQVKSELYRLAVKEKLCSEYGMAQNEAVRSYIVQLFADKPEFKIYDADKFGPPSEARSAALSGLNIYRFKRR